MSHPRRIAHPHSQSTPRTPSRPHFFRHHTDREPGTDRQRRRRRNPLADPLAPPKPTILDIIRHIPPLGWVASALIALVILIMVVAVCHRLVSPAFAGLICAAGILLWVRLVYREARYDAYGDLMMMTDNSFPDLPD